MSALLVHPNCPDSTPILSCWRADIFTHHLLHPVSPSGDSFPPPSKVVPDIAAPPAYANWTAAGLTLFSQGHKSNKDVWGHGYAL